MKKIKATFGPGAQVKFDQKITSKHYWANFSLNIALHQPNAIKGYIPTLNKLNLT